MLSGIKFIKMCCWEDFFINKLEIARDAELKFYKKLSILRIVQGFCSWLTPVIVIMSTFTTYIYFGNKLTAEIALTLISTFEVLKFPILFFPRYLSFIAELLVSVQRIEDFLLGKEVN